jgi:hypothetical protein
VSKRTVAGEGLELRVSMCRESSAASGMESESVPFGNVDSTSFAMADKSGSDRDAVVSWSLEVENDIVERR